MNEQCTGCPWLDETKKQCRRTPPRFCSVDDTAGARPAPERPTTPERRDDSQTKVHRAA